jgi:hypothetical protein
VCGLDEETVSPRDAVVAVRSFPRRYRAQMAGYDPHGDDPDSPLRRRPDARTWSALEYTAHVADRLDHLGPAIRRVMVEDEPALTFPDFAERVVSHAYNDKEKLEVLGWLELVCGDLASILDGVQPDDWRRPAHVDGSPRDALGLARDAVHEGSHHLRDVQRVLAAVR